MKTYASKRPSGGPYLHAPILAALSSLFALGCALTSKSDPIAPRYFSPERTEESAIAPGSRQAGELRLGRVTGASHLDERLIYRDSQYELGYYQERRWTEEPAHYLARRLARVLFEQRGIRQVVGGPAPTLEVELTAFEEIRRPSPIVRVAMVVKLHDQRLVRWEETLTVDQPIVVEGRSDLPDATVEALGLALRTAVDRIADRVLIELVSTSAPEPSPPRGQAARAERIKDAERIRDAERIKEAEGMKRAAEAPGDRP